MSCDVCCVSLQNNSPPSLTFWKYCCFTACNWGPLLEHCCGWGKSHHPKSFFLLADTLYPVTSQRKECIMDPLPQFGTILKGHPSSRIPHGVSWGLYCNCVWTHLSLFSTAFLIVPWGWSWEPSPINLHILISQRNASPSLSSQFGCFVLPRGPQQSVDNYPVSTFYYKSLISIY